MGVAAANAAVAARVAVGTATRVAPAVAAAGAGAMAAGGEVEAASRVAARGAGTVAVAAVVRVAQPAGAGDSTNECRSLPSQASADPMRPPLTTHAARAADLTRSTLCGRSIDDVPLAPWSTWPTCAACIAAIEGSSNHKRALGLAAAQSDRVTALR